MDSSLTLHSTCGLFLHYSWGHILECWGVWVQIPPVKPSPVSVLQHCTPRVLPASLASVHTSSSLGSLCSPLPSLLGSPCRPQLKLTSFRRPGLAFPLFISEHPILLYSTYVAYSNGARRLCYTMCHSGEYASLHFTGGGCFPLWHLVFL